MKLCINCDTLNDLDAVFCSNCGMSLIGVPYAEQPRRLKQQKHEETLRRLEQPPTASGVVFLFGHLFARPWGASSALGLATQLVLSAAFQTPDRDDGRTPVRVPYSCQQIAVRDLGLKLLEAAFVSLAQDGYISLRVERTKTLFLSQEAVVISSANWGSFESLLIPVW